MNILGKQVKVISKDYPSYGDIGVAIGSRVTPVGILVEVDFGERTASYLSEYLKVVESSQ